MHIDTSAPSPMQMRFHLCEILHMWKSDRQSSKFWLQLPHCKSLVNLRDHRKSSWTYGNMMAVPLSGLIRSIRVTPCRVQCSVCLESGHNSKDRIRTSWPTPRSITVPCTGSLRAVKKSTRVPGWRTKRREYEAKTEVSSATRTRKWFIAKIVVLFCDFGDSTLETSLFIPCWKLSSEMKKWFCMIE